MLKPIDILVTGGAGFIGTNLLETLCQGNFELVSVDLYESTSVKPLNIERVVLDVAILVPRINTKKIVHLASETNIRDSISNPRKVFDRNTMSMLNVLELIRKDYADSLVFTSSASAQEALSPYLASKVACEALCKSYSISYNLDIKVLKLSSVYGPHSIHKKSVIARFIKACFNYEPLIIYGSGAQARDFIYVDDVVDAILDDYEGFVSTGTLTTVKTLAEMVSELSLKYLNYSPAIKHDNPVLGEVINPTLHTDFEAKTDLYKGLDLTFQWYRSNYATK